MTEEISIFTDGGARGNPGPAAIGCVIKQESMVNGQMSNVVVWEYGEYIGETTNNQAEYRALIRALERSLELKLDRVHCFLDSELLVKQIKREYRVKEPTLQTLYLKVFNLTQLFRSIDFTHIPRERNKHADRMVNEALDKQVKKW